MEKGLGGLTPNFWLIVWAQVLSLLGSMARGTPWVTSRWYVFSERIPMITYSQPMKERTSLIMPWSFWSSSSSSAISLV